MKMKPYGAERTDIAGCTAVGTGQVQASETLNTILGGGAGGVARTMIGKELGGAARAPWWGGDRRVPPVGLPRPTGATRMRLPSGPSVPWGPPSARASGTLVA